MYRSGLINTLVTHANMKGLGLTHLFRDLHGFMPPLLKTKQNRNNFIPLCNAKSATVVVWFQRPAFFCLHMYLCMNFEHVFIRKFWRIIKKYLTTQSFFRKPFTCWNSNNNTRLTRSKFHFTQWKKWIVTRDEWSEIFDSVTIAIQKWKIWIQDRQYVLY